jgi:hypothetical protein
MFKYSGRIEPGSERHSLKSEAKSGALIAPNYAYNEWTQKFDIPQYAPTVVGRAQGYDPGGDCQGNFMSFKYVVDNNCYAYACCIATNSYAQPGRASAGSSDLRVPENFTPTTIRNNATLDGLLYVGADLPDPRKSPGPGHLVALLLSAAVSRSGGDPLANGDVDYHWVRCDDPDHYASWSQKDGDGQVTNYDFAGQPIEDPRRANWTVNQGPSDLDPTELSMSYEFVCFLWVPQQGVHII